MVNKRLHEIFNALSITDLKLYFFLGETMKHEKERKRGRDNRHSRHIKTQRGDTAGQAARHRQIAEEPSMLLDYTVGLIRAAALLQFESLTSHFSAACNIFNNPTIEESGNISHSASINDPICRQNRGISDLTDTAALLLIQYLHMLIQSLKYSFVIWISEHFFCAILMKYKFIIFLSPTM